MLRNIPMAMSKILIIGGTGYMGKFVVEASAKSGHPTFSLIRETTLITSKAELIEGYKKSGVTILNGDLHDHESLVKAIKQVDIVISTVGSAQLMDQVKIIAAMKEAGNVKRFLPSEFGTDVDQVDTVEPAKTLLATKVAVRRAIEAAGIPYTYVVSNYSAGYALPMLAQEGPPTGEVLILGDGNTKAIIVDEDDIATYTIKAVDDPRTLNKILYVMPPSNFYTHSELVSLWEKKTGRALERVFCLSEDEIQKKIREAQFPVNFLLSINYLIFVKGETTNIVIDPSSGVEATRLYPDVDYTTVEEYYDRLFSSNSQLTVFHKPSIHQETNVTSM